MPPLRALPSATVESCCWPGRRLCTLTRVGAWVDGSRLACRGLSWSSLALKAGPPYHPHRPPPPTPTHPTMHAAEEGRKAAFAVRGAKLAVAAVRHYLVAVLAEESSTEGQVRAEEAADWLRVQGEAASDP